LVGPGPAFGRHTRLQRYRHGGAVYFGNAAWTNSGWRFSITPSLTPGQHTVSAIGYDSQGATTTLRNSLTITAP